MTYWIEYLFVMLPGLLFSFITILPLLLGVIFAIRHVWQKKRIHYFRNLCGSIAAGVILLMFLYGSIFGDDLSSSSTAGLIFIFAPIYATIAFGLIYGICAFILGKPQDNKPISSNGLMLLSIPATILLVLIVGLFKIAIESNDMAMAHKASNPANLIYLYEKSLHGKADSFSVSLFLAQNPNTPPEILRQLASHEHRAIRTLVARHKSTPQDVLKILKDDNATCIQK